MKKQGCLVALLALLCGSVLAGELKTYEVVCTVGTNLSAVTNSVKIPVCGWIERVVVDSVTADATSSVSVARLADITSLDALPVLTLSGNTADRELYPMAYSGQSNGTVNSNVMSRLVVYNETLRVIVSDASKECVNRVLVTVDPETE